MTALQELIQKLESFKSSTKEIEDLKSILKSKKV
mgnify:CR=1 FL=1